MKAKQILPLLLLVIASNTYCQKTGTQKAVVLSYNGIPVFYNCKPLHHYTTLGVITSSAVINNLAQAFSKYSWDAKNKFPSCTGIIIKDVTYHEDSIEVIQAEERGLQQDTAIFTQPIFLSAKPLHPYEVIATMRGKANWGSLNTNLNRYYDKAGKRQHADGILLDDINYAFKKDEIRVLRWKKL